MRSAGLHKFSHMSCISASSSHRQFDNNQACSAVQATEDKNNAIAQAEKTANKAKLADRLINGLSGEYKRWNETITKFGIQEGALQLQC